MIFHIIFTKLEIHVKNLPALAMGTVNKLQKYKERKTGFKE